MAALSRPRTTPRGGFPILTLAVAAGARIWGGALTCIDAATGYARPGATATGLAAVGAAELSVDNSDGADGDRSVEVRRGVFRWDNSDGAAAVTAAHAGLPCWIVDDQTVAAHDGGGARSPAGIVARVDARGVWVETPLPPLPGAPGARILEGSATTDAGSVPGRGTNTTVEIDVPGAAPGDLAIVPRPDGLESRLLVEAWVSAADTVTVRLVSTVGGLVEPGERTYRAYVFKA